MRHWFVSVLTVLASMGLVTATPAGALEPKDDGPDPTDLVELFVAVDDVVYADIDEAVDIDVTVKAQSAV